MSAFLTIFLSFFCSLAVSAQEEDEADEMAEAVRLFNQGQDAHEKGDLENALKLYDAALKLVPEIPEVEYQRGAIFIQLGKPDEAEKAFRRALELREDWTLAMAGLGGILVQKNQFAEAEKLLNQAIELEDLNFPAYTALTELRLKTKASPEVLKELLAKIRILTSKANPPASIWASRAALERFLGDKQAAKMSVKNALSIDANNVSALNERAEIALTEGDFTRAAEDAKKLIQLSPNSIHNKLLLARVYITSGNNAEAINILNSLDQKNAAVIEFRNALVVNSNKGVGDLEKILESEPKNADVLARLCVLLRAENPVKSLEYCRRASQLEPENINHAVGYGAALVQAKQFEQAVALLTKLKQIAPDNFTARANLATALFQLKRYQEAKTEYLWLAEKQPDLAGAYYHLGIVHDQLEEYLDAMANYQQFLRLADAKANQLEIEKVNLRLPILQRQINQKKGKK
ncbi:MAG TPA: tetratricopeptide repeat protein [Pyrinomonadaceae bacterium]|nr:tetratricopeptide repeat protein [Pyrinomonadaceae bacterium]